MNANHTGTTKDPSNEFTSVFSCPHLPDGFTWDLNNTTILWIIVAISSAASPVIILLNAVVVIAVKQRRELQRHSYILLSHLAVTDLLMGVVGLPLFAAVDALVARQFMLEYACTLDLVNGFFIYLLALSSLYHLTAIAWERYVAVQKWIDYKVIITKSRLRKLSIISWLLAAFAASSALVTALAGVDNEILEKWHIAMNVIAAACLILIGYFYVMVYLGIRNRKIDEISNVTALVRAKREVKVAKTTALLTAALIFSYLPAIGSFILGKVFPAVGSSSVSRLFVMLTLLNSLLNPALYCFRDRKFRIAVHELLGLRKPDAIRPAVGTARFVRRKDPAFGSVQLHNVEKPGARLARPASREVVVVSNCGHGIGVSRDKLLKRSSSDPTLNNCTSSFHGLEQRRPSTVVITSAIINFQSGVRRQKGKSKLVAPKDAPRPQGTPRLARNRPRSKSCDASTSGKFPNRLQNSQEERFRRPKTAPAKIRNEIAPSETSTARFATRFCRVLSSGRKHGVMNKV